jgi:hypothetical protein
MHKDKPESTSTPVLTASSTSTSQPTTIPVVSAANKTNVGAIAGGSMGAVVVLVLLVVAGVWWFIRRYPPRSSSTPLPSLPPPGSIYSPENNHSYSSFSQTFNRKYYVSFSSNFAADFFGISFDV